MKKFRNIFCSLSFLFLFFGLSTPLSSHSATLLTETTSFCSAYHYVPQSLPTNTVIQIRHRSPHEADEITVPSPYEQVLYTLKLNEIEKVYLPKWKTYFFVQDDKLPTTLAYPPTHSLRAPPFSC